MEKGKLSASEAIKNDYIPLNKNSTVVFKMKPKNMVKVIKPKHKQNPENSVVIAHFPAHWLDVFRDTPVSIARKIIQKAFANFGIIQNLEIIPENQDLGGKTIAPVTGHVVDLEDESTLKTSTTDDILGAKEEATLIKSQDGIDNSEENLLLESMFKSPDAYWVRLYIQYTTKKNIRRQKDAAFEAYTSIKSYKLISVRITPITCITRCSIPNRIKFRYNVLSKFKLMKAHISLRNLFANVILKSVLKTT